MRENERAVIEAAKAWRKAVFFPKDFNISTYETKSLVGAIEALGSAPLSTDADVRREGWMECAEWLDTWINVSDDVKTEALRRYPRSETQAEAKPVELEANPTEPPEEAKPRMMRCPEESNGCTCEIHQGIHPEQFSCGSHFCSRKPNTNSACVPVSEAKLEARKDRTSPDNIEDD